MSPDWIIGALALVTIGSVIALAVLHFGFHLKDPKNMDAFKRVAADRESATTKLADEGVNGRSLRERLDAAPKIDDNLSPRSSDGLGLVDVLFDTKWSSVRGALGEPPR